MNLNAVKESYTVDKREDARKDPWAHYVARPLSFYPAWLCIKMGISANSVTIAGLLIGIGGCGLMAFGFLVWGAVMVNIYGMMDYVDGDIARATNTQSEYGGRLDGLGYLVMTATLFISVGIGLNSMLLVALGTIASFTRIFRYAVSYQANLSPESGSPNILVRAGMAIIAIRDPLLLACAIAGCLDMFIYFYVVVNAGELLMVLSKVIKPPREN